MFVSHVHLLPTHCPGGRALSATATDRNDLKRERPLRGCRWMRVLIYGGYQTCVKWYESVFNKVEVACITCQECYYDRFGQKWQCHQKAEI